MPALLTRMSIGPDIALEPIDRALHLVMIVTSKRDMNIMRDPTDPAPPRESIRVAAVDLTEAPCSARPRASVSPMPCDDPVTSALACEVEQRECHAGSVQPDRST